MNKPTYIRPSVLKMVLGTEDLIQRFTEPTNDNGDAVFGMVGAPKQVTENSKGDFVYWKIRIETAHRRPMWLTYFHPQGSADYQVGEAKEWLEHILQAGRPYYFYGIIAQKNEFATYLVLKWAYWLPREQLSKMKALYRKSTCSFIDACHHNADMWEEVEDRSQQGEDEADELCDKEVTDDDEDPVF